MSWARTDPHGLPLDRRGGLSVHRHLCRLAHRQGQGRQQPPPRALRHLGSAASGRAAGLGACRQRRRNQCRRAADRAHPRKRHQRRADHRHHHVGQGCRSAARAPHHPPICAARPQARGQQFPQPLDAGPRHHRQIRDMADDHPRARRAPRSAGAGQRPPVGPLLCLVEEARLPCRGAVREPRPCGGADRTGRRALCLARRAAGDRLRQPQGRHQPAARQ